ncbi:hypothetical protein IFM89_037477 [Coptis chinensis]|uniref:Uncharacterized protein n=1 Tax=Coptis chinensis TaxID=261450 RepID=A0A835LUE1_9MAGN|nr:hypothetical protein IFM89_037477 [Coptis chinensis]
MEKEDLLVKSRGAAPPLIFLVTIFLQIITIFLQRLKKRRSSSAEQNQLREQIKELVREAESFSNPSTFAQAAKLRRMAAAKEKELLKISKPALRFSGKCRNSKAWLPNLLY